VLGRDEACDIALEDPLMSGRHARIVALESGVVLEDLGSTNGVYLNGMRVNKRDRLHAGDRIVIGTTELSVFSLWIR
jgi:pSer/pThr/pTyr-binding forkhead associated (FHA) protein